mmetsp:Transcript_53233/g.124596  ORF Transcript_53233/g.124596 Transcript_53233/m.124596 type:complete len:238 (+) Transcript_53233:829-1542(+)
MHWEVPNLEGSLKVEKVPSSTVFLSMTIISPGSTSRTYCALHRSSAHVSEATTYPSVPLGPRPTSLPRQRGRKPLGSRTATRCESVKITTEKAPSAWVMASKIWSSWLLRFECEIRCRKSSESTVDCVSTPWSWKKERSSEALLRFPLCASARFFPLRYRTQNGWNPSSAVLPPAVEYRVCPIAWIPSSCFTSSGLNTSVTRPCPLCNRNSFAPSGLTWQDTSPAPSCPRCCRPTMP